MWIKFKISKGQAEGIREYLQKQGAIEKPTREDVTAFIMSEVEGGLLNNEQHAVSDYVAKWNKVIAEQLEAGNVNT